MNSRALIATAASLLLTAEASAFHPHHKSQHGTTGGFVTTKTTGFTVHSTGFVVAPTGFSTSSSLTGFTVVPTGFSTGFGTTGFGTGFGTTGFGTTGFTVVPTGFGTTGFGDANLALPAGLPLDIARRLICPQGGGGSSGVSGDVASTLKEIRDELKALRADLHGTPAPGTSPAPGASPTIPGATRVPTSFAPTGFVLNPTTAQAGGQVGPLAQAYSYTHLAEVAIDEAKLKIAEARRFPATVYPPAEIDKVEARLKGLADRLK
jgi:hypothetical protein